MFRLAGKSACMALVCIVGVGLLFTGCKAEDSAALVKPKLLWKSGFSVNLSGVSASDDGAEVLVWWNKVVKENPISGEQDVKSKLFLMDKAGKRLWSHAADAMIRTATISPFNKFVMVVFSAGESGEGSEVLLLSREGKPIKEFFTWGSVSKISDDGELILVDDALDLQSLEVYNNKGALLWKGEHSGEAEFVSRNEIAVFDGQKIISYGAHDGRKLWETTLPGGTDVLSSAMTHSREGERIALSTGDSVDPSIYLIEGNTGNLIRKLDYGFVYSGPRWQSPVSVGFLKGTKLLIALLPQWGRSLGSLLCFDNETGTLAWQKRVKGQPRLYTLPDDTHLAIAGTLCREVPNAEGVQLEPEPYNLYVIDQTGRTLSEADIKGSVEFSK